MFDLGASTFSWMWAEPALESVRRLGRLGFRSFDVITVPGHLWPASMNASEVRDLARILLEEGLRLDSLNLPALDHNLVSAIREVRDLAVAEYRRLLECAAELGARGIVVVPGRVSSLLPPGVRSTEAWALETIGALARDAAALKLDLFLETHPLTPFSTAEAMLALCRELDHPSVKVAYDVANAEFVGENQAEAMGRLGSFLGQVHVSDGTRDRWRHDAPGRGDIDFAAVFDSLRQIAFTGTAIVEIISDTPLDDYTAALTRFGPEIG